MSKATPTNKAIQIIQPTSEHAFELKIDTLEEILNVDEIRDRYVVVVSIAGALRQGKSFLLNFFLKYLYACYKRNDVSRFLVDNVNKGFNWRGGSKPETSGILLWPEIFTYDYTDGEKIAIVLMDTQGSFDSESSVRDCSTLFALSAMLSSVLCYNVMRNIREDDLQHLQLFTEYGKLSLEESQEKPFQTLLFIVRDWPYAYEHEFGWNGGQGVISDRFKKTPKQTEVMKNLRDQLSSSFDSIRGFLMPYPGDAVAQDQHYDGNLKEISTKFLNMVEQLVSELLSPENLIVKQIHGQEIRAKDLIQYFKSYVTVFNGNELPEPKSIFDATAESFNLIAYLDAKSKYTELITKAINDKLTYFKVDELKSVHDDAKQKCLSQFNNKPKMGGSKLVEKYLKLLQSGILDELLRFDNLNQKKKQEYAKQVEEKILLAKTESIYQYKTSFEKCLQGTYLNQSKLNEIHTQLKQQTKDLFKSKVKLLDAEFSVPFIKQLDTDLEKEFLSFKLKNSENEKSALESQRKKDSFELDSLKVAVKEIKAEQRTSNYNSFPGYDYSLYSPPSYASSTCYTPSRANCYSPAPSSYSSSSSSGTRVNYTQSENSRLQSLFGQYGNDYSRVTREFNNSRACSTPRNAKQIQGKCYRMRRNGDIN